MPQLALLPKTPLRTVTCGLWSTRTAARFAFAARRPSRTTYEDPVTKIVSRLSLRSVVTVTWAACPWARIVTGRAAVPAMPATSNPR